MVSPEMQQFLQAAEKTRSWFQIFFAKFSSGFEGKSIQILVVKNDWPAGAAGNAFIKGKLFCSDL